METSEIKYCEDLFNYRRRKTVTVDIGGIPLGSGKPIRVQSMTNTNTMNTEATVEQTIRLFEAGCEYVRITAPSRKEADNLAVIKDELKKRGYSVPLIADIHYTPAAAETAAKIIEKVRINPGNYIDKKKFEKLEYTDEEYLAEIDKIRVRITPLIELCKKHNAAMRIGTNHGSLSDRIMSRYGDSPEGMVESALEFVRICRELDYHQIVLSMKASNTQIMVQAYRLLVQKMAEEDMHYPLHLGVTEAGGGEEGRIKSAVGIGALLEDGLGDTIRVSLTEDPVEEIPVAKALVKRYENREGQKEIPAAEETGYNPYIFSKRESFRIERIGGTLPPVVVTDLSSENLITENDLYSAGYLKEEKTGTFVSADTAGDYLYTGGAELGISSTQGLKIIYDHSAGDKLIDKRNFYPMISSDDYRKAETFNRPVFVKTFLNQMDKNFLNRIRQDENAVIVLVTESVNRTAEMRRTFVELLNNDVKNPVIMKLDYDEASIENFIVNSSADFGPLFIDGFGDGIWPAKTVPANYSCGDVNRIAYGILQAARARISRTEFIACPSCGRTQFELQSTTEMIKKHMGHLKGLKIAVMGCIVNGPGEMADADYGYVGSGPGRISLYRGQKMVKKGVDEKFALDELINLIKSDGKWKEA